mmetsp:Transcript_7604/g.16192  ORF Transcript_7604/g.16192 Transcript_7604/m.16192 type:complete len:105 (-) Transcript_7604:75-389(-)
MPEKGAAASKATETTVAPETAAQDMAENVVAAPCSFAPRVCSGARRSAAMLVRIGVKHENCANQCDDSWQHPPFFVKYSGSGARTATMTATWNACISRSRTFKR